MYSDMKHGKKILTETYYDGQVVGAASEWQSEMFTDKQYIMRDVIDSLTPLTTGLTHKLTIEVTIDKKNRYKLTQRWVT